MDAFAAFFLQWGYLGLLVGSFIAGSVVPLSSEAIVVACVGPFHMNPWFCLLAATIGNVSGGMTCYWLGTKGNLEWIERYAHVKKEKLERAERFIQGRGACMGFFAFIPILGTAITVALGYMRAGWLPVMVSMIIGKVLRYAAIIWGTIGIAAMF
ncbi:MAG: DedA family protein [Muribaculaceae bacterium]|nr:DedA family protein [Muribaculaceae bacterium]